MNALPPADVDVKLLGTGDVTTSFYAQDDLDDAENLDDDSLFDDFDDDDDDDEEVVFDESEYEELDVGD